MEINSDNKKDYFLGLSVLTAVFVIAASWAFTARFKIQTGPEERSRQEFRELENKIIPKSGVILPIVWGDLGRRLVESGTIDRKKFGELYSNRENLKGEIAKLLDDSDNGRLKINSENSGLILNLLWAFGLANKNPILEKGQMAHPRYGDPGVFASTGGWALAQGEAMNHYSRHSFVILTPQQQEMVERVSKNIFRPCCDNPTYFPDCNHGMAMLGLLELMAAQGLSEGEMYKIALQVNAYWFPDTYLVIARYLESKGISWDEADPKEILGYGYSSASGYQQILSRVAPPKGGYGASCGL